jgi:hypothetical protein
MLIEKNRRIARQRRQIAWLLLFILIGIIWIYSLNQEIENLKSEISDLQRAVKNKELIETNLSKKIDSIKNATICVLPAEPIPVKVKKPKKENTDTIKVVKTLDTLIPIKKDSL